GERRNGHLAEELHQLVPGALPELTDRRSGAAIVAVVEALQVKRRALERLNYFQDRHLLRGPCQAAASVRATMTGDQPRVFERGNLLLQKPLWNALPGGDVTGGEACIPAGFLLNSHVHQR